MDEAKRLVIRVEWSSEERVFVVLSDESMATQFSAPELLPDKRSFVDEDNQTNDQSLTNMIERFQGCLAIRDASAAVMEMQTLRIQTLTKILGTPAPLKWLSSFLYQWQNVLRSMNWSDNVKLSPVEYCQELIGLASGWKIIGDIVRARSALGRCFELVRRHLKSPFTRPSLPEGRESDALRHAAVIAKKLLLECVSFQSSLVSHKKLSARHEAPPHVLASLTKEFWMLLRQAPFSVEISILLAHSLMKQRQFALVTRFLGQSVLAGASAELTLVHARALAYVGFYRESLRVAELFVSQVTEPKEDMVAVESLRAHCCRLKELLAKREKADAFLRQDQFEKAATTYDECLGRADPADHKQIAALLFDRGNALLGLEQIPAAIKDLRKSVQLDPANKLASLRLQTACLQLETERVRNELSGTGFGVNQCVTLPSSSIQCAFFWDSSNPGGCPTHIN